MKLKFILFCLDIWLPKLKLEYWNSMSLNVYYIVLSKLKVVANLKNCSFRNCWKLWLKMIRLWFRNFWKLWLKMIRLRFKNYGVRNETAVLSFEKNVAVKCRATVSVVWLIQPRFLSFAKTVAVNGVVTVLSCGTKKTAALTFWVNRGKNFRKPRPLLLATAT